MNVLIANTIEECIRWNKTAVVVDVLSTSTTICALLAQNTSRLVIACPDEANAKAVLARGKDFALLADEDITLRHKENSSVVAKGLSPSKPVCLVSGGVGLALQYVRNASTILFGGFCNFRAVVQSAQTANQDVLLIPTAMICGRLDEEDFLFAQAFKEFVEHISAPEKFLEEFKATVRFAKLCNKDSSAIAQEVETAFTLDGYSIVPRAVYSTEGQWAVCFPYGQQPDSGWATLSNPEKTSPTQTQPLPAIPNVKVQSMADKTLSAPHILDNPLQQTDEVKAPSAKLPQAKPQEAPLSPEEAQARFEKQLQQISILGGEKPNSNSSRAISSKGFKRFFSNLFNLLKKDKTEVVGQSATSAPTLQPTAPLATESSVTHPNTSEATLVGDPKTLSQVELSTGSIPLNKRGPSVAVASQAPSEDELPDMVPVVQDDISPASNRPQEQILDLNLSDSPNEPELQKEQSADPSPSVNIRPHRKKAIVLFSGGLDSTTCLYWAMAQGYECEALSVSYGQRHVREIAFAQAITRHLGIKHYLINLRLPWLVTSSLVDKEQNLPDIAVEQIPNSGVPSTYVPGRNLMFLSIAGSLLDSVGADAIVAGPNAVDFSGYPDCTPSFYKAAGEALNRGTTRGVRNGIEVLAPLMEMNKAQIVRLAVELQVPLQYTWSCYAGGEKPCGKCDSCKLRAKGFREAGYKDPALSE